MTKVKEKSRTNKHARRTERTRIISWSRRNLTRHCFYCGARLNIGEPNATGAPYNYDHYIPKAMGGHSRPNNLVRSCRTCNNRKGCLHPEAFRSKYFPKGFFAERANRGEVEPSDQPTPTT